MTPSAHIILVAGEASGDLHGAHLVKELKRQNPSLTFSGLGGPQMQAAGVLLDQDFTKLAVVGFWEVLKNYGKFKKAFDSVLRKIKTEQPAAVILIDYPGFNLRLAKALKDINTKVIYYISPQLWAWKEQRVELVRKYVDKMLVLFDFEKDFYARHGIDAVFVGHPLIDEIDADLSSSTKTKTTPEKKSLSIGLLPGSREKEIQRHLPVMLAAGELLYKKYPHITFTIFQAPSLPASLIQNINNQYRLPCAVLNHSYTAVQQCDLCIVASGTATLETAILEKPMVVMYKTSPLTYWLAKMFVKIPYIGLVNVVAQKQIVPECIQHDASPENIAQTLENIFTNEIKIADIKGELKKIKNMLGESGASQRAAEEILKTIQS